MNKTAENKTGGWAKLKRGLQQRRAYWIGSLGIVLTVGMALAVIFLLGIYPGT